MRSLRRSVVAFALALAPLACGEDPAATPELVVPPKDGAKDENDRTVELVFRVARSERRPDGSRLLSVVATHEGRAVGFDLELGAWRENPPGYVNMPTWDCKALLRSQGGASDELLRVLDELYATRLGVARMADAAEVQGFSPWKEPSDLESERAKLTLLLPSDPDFDQGGELRVEVDLDRARLFVREKDARFRLAVVRTLSATP